jgi:hypothetical protein
MEAVSRSTIARHGTEFETRHRPIAVKHYRRSVWLSDRMGAPKGHPKYGGGRPPGGLNRVTLEIKELAREYRSVFGTRNDLTRVAAVKELFDRGYGRAVQPLSGPPGAISIDTGGSQSLATIAQKVALAFRIAAMHGADPPMIEDAGDGGA